jgi:hypothetical protein
MRIPQDLDLQYGEPPFGGVFATSSAGSADLADVLAQAASLSDDSAFLTTSPACIGRLLNVKELLYLPCRTRRSCLARTLAISPVDDQRLEASLSVCSALVATLLADSSPRTTRRSCSHCDRLGAFDLVLGRHRPAHGRQGAPARACGVCVRLASIGSL